MSSRTASDRPRALPANPPVLPCRRLQAGHGGGASRHCAKHFRSVRAGELPVVVIPAQAGIHQKTNVMERAIAVAMIDVRRQ